MYKYFFKRFFDLVFSLIGVILISPIFLTVTAILYFSNEGKPFFFQRRPGKNEKVFTIMKFKTMNDKKDENGELLPDHMRITKVGNFVRKTSLDEIPQLFNVVKGEMALIGPRPLIIPYLPLYSEEQKKRHNIRPGITGWAQINGRNAISWPKKFAYDVHYVENLSFLFDLKILFLTAKKIVVREGVNSEENVTMPPFMGETED